MSRRSKTLVVVGDRAVGKSSLVHRLLEEPVDFTTYNPTIDDNYSAAWKLPSKLKGLKLKREKDLCFVPLLTTLVSALVRLLLTSLKGLSQP